jgi:molecular chaperone GrpE (heat shock protein)
MHSRLNDSKSPADCTQLLQNLMQRVGVSNFKTLSHAAGISERQILRLRQGKIAQMRVEVLLKLSQTLQISLTELITTFSGLSTQQTSTEPELLQQITDLQTEYQRLLQTLKQQRELLQQEFQQTSWQILESLFLYWPTAAQKARENPELPAVKIVPLVQQPLDKLLQAWGIDAIAPVGAELPYDPQLHQLIEGNAQPGEIVKVSYTGYRQGEKLLYRVQVIPR